ncbi:hypothetical protein RP726_01110 [Candidatus Methylospira mobilis]|uniref:hypothetical protein n=1 Tax=Candidatus Methylospira mobilis TaxID=1808979 RepID=UPI0028E5EB86|nr:hypothetical protein [Candidatus Methylospira mobilis]WNV05027.1 hypothetical protein RP726_01110 [Candidatus Methylospira mobilis]
MAGLLSVGGFCNRHFGTLMPVGEVGVHSITLGANLPMMPIKDLIDYYGPLHDDVEQCLVGIEVGEDIEYWKRSYLRCLCTFVEARVYLIKTELKANHLIECPKFTPEILGFLNGTEWSVMVNKNRTPVQAAFL